MEYADRIKNHHTQKGTLALSFTGQAGFLMKNSKDKILAIDLYLSDLVEKLDGNKRLMPALFSPKDLEVDMILASHHHIDHLDMEALPIWLDKGIPFIGCRESERICRNAGYGSEQIHGMDVGDRMEMNGYSIEAVFADHGDTAPDAIGFLIQSEGITVYFSGDTSYQHIRMQPVADHEIDVAILPINGEYGNMNELDAAMFAALAKPKMVIPCHYGMFARHKGSPWDFQQAMEKYALESQPYFMTQSEILDLQKEDKKQG